jgi:hypothetical protein
MAESITPQSALELAGAILAFAKSQSPNRELIASALRIAQEANSSDRFAGQPSESR